MNVLETAGTAVGMRRHGRDYNDFALPVIQAAIVKLKGTGAVGTVYEFPAFMGMPGYGIYYCVLSDIGDIVHGV